MSNMENEKLQPKPKRILADGRTIAAAMFDDATGTEWRVGSSGVTKIVSYRERSEMGYVPWLAIYYLGDKDGPRYRVAARNYIIEYVRGGA